jgi:phosphate transport system substrate-binding protein
MLALAAALCALTGCAGGEWDAERSIDVVSREDGSGTRGSFIELFGIQQTGENGSKKDMTTKEAVIAKQTDIMMMNISGDRYAVGYTSLGSLNETVRAVKIDGVAPSGASVKYGTYAVARPYYIATRGAPTGAARDFIDFILSSDGQAVAAKNYVSIDDDAPSYTPSGLTGKIVVAGSTSVTPLMEKLKEAYIAKNPGVKIEIQQSDSSAGMADTASGVCDIGMSSRDLKAGELETLTPIQIALDGIAVVVNNDNPVTNLTTAQVRAIFTGGAEKWSEVTG